MFTGVKKMKKEYTKPVMEGEAFVANEYVAACTTMDCMGCDKVWTEYNTDISEMINKYGLSKMSEEVYIYEAEDGCSNFQQDKTKPQWIDDICKDDNIRDPKYAVEQIVWTIYKHWAGDTEIEKYHPVQLSSGINGHPNASV